MSRQSQLHRTAYHEAGHAVAAFMLDIGIGRASIRPCRMDNSLGHVTFRTTAELRSVLSDLDICTPRHEVWVLKKAIATFAGHEAERIATGRANHAGASEDRKSIADMLLTIYGDPQSVELCAKWLCHRAVTLLRMPHVWPMVEAVAEALKERRTLRASDVRQVCRAAFQALL